MIVRVILSIVVAVIVGILVNVVGKALVDAGAGETGGYIDGVSALVGILAGLWYFFAGPYPSRRV